jgi:hypothetical protein
LIRLAVKEPPARVNHQTGCRPDRLGASRYSEAAA